jgi:hypothetical protein
LLQELGSLRFSQATDKIVLEEVKKLYGDDRRTGANGDDRAHSHRHDSANRANRHKATSRSHPNH